MIKSTRLRLFLVLIVASHVLLTYEPLNPSCKRLHLKRESDKSDDLCHELIVTDRPLGFQRLDNSCIDEELTISKHSSMNRLTILLRLFLLDGIDSDPFHLTSELVIDSESVLFSDGLLNCGLGLGHLRFALWAKLPEFAVRAGGKRGLSVGCID